MESYEKLSSEDATRSKRSAWESLSDYPDFADFRKAEAAKEHERKLGVEIMNLSPDDNNPQCTAG